jgi:hypothetical protein
MELRWFSDGLVKSRARRGIACDAEEINALHNVQGGMGGGKEDGSVCPADICTRDADIRWGDE